MLPSLYELAGEYHQAAVTMSNMDMDEQTIADTLEGLSGALEEKAKNVAAFVRNLESTAEQIKLAEKQMADRRKAMENRAERIREYLKTNMELAGITQIECPHFKLAIKKNPPSVVIDAESQIPADYMTQPVAPPPAPDKKLIAQAIKDGFEVPGAHLETGKTRLDIR